MSDVLSKPPIDGVAGVILNAPPHNYLSAEQVERVADILEALDRDATCRAVVLSSRGRSFCAGVDLGTGARDESNLRRVGGSLETLYRHAARIFRCRKPLIAAVQGPAVGGGLGLALAADFRVASREARFVSNFVKLGTHPGFGLTCTLPAVVGARFADYMFLTGQRIRAEQAERAGLVDELVEAGDLEKAIGRLSIEIATGAPLSLLAIRATRRTGFADRVEAAMAVELAAQRRLRNTRDYLEGVRAVAERRPGEFFGA